MLPASQTEACVLHGSAARPWLVLEQQEFRQPPPLFRHQRPFAWPLRPIPFNAPVDQPRHCVGIADLGNGCIAAPLDGVGIRDGNNHVKCQSLEKPLLPNFLLKERPQ